MKTLVYGTKEKWDGIFLTAFSLESEDAKAFAARFESELRKETHDIVGVRLWREEQEGNRVILYGWYQYDHDEAKDILGENHYVLELIENAIENTAKDLGYQTVRKSHSAQVPLAASSGNRRLASELVAVAKLLVAAEKTAMYQPTGEFKSMVGWKTIAFRETEKVSNEIENVLADLETYITKESFHSTHRKLGRLEQSASDAAKAYQAIAQLCKDLSGRINIGIGTERGMT